MQMETPIQQDAATDPSPLRSTSQVAVQATTRAKTYAEIARQAVVPEVTGNGMKEEPVQATATEHDFRKWERADAKSYLEANMDKYVIEQHIIDLVFQNYLSGGHFLKVTEEKLVTFYKLPPGAARGIDALVKPQAPPKTYFSWFIKIQEATMAHLVNIIEYTHLDIDIIEATNLTFMSAMNGM
ncbi:hypothetical protein EV426DRAFT_720654 [Tirmania nivea]|nr:hypothetical protein EV426DRAFT_720654 [Tirmania nivea]